MVCKFLKVLKTSLPREACDDHLEVGDTAELKIGYKIYKGSIVKTKDGVAELLFDGYGEFLTNKKD